MRMVWEYRKMCSLIVMAANAPCSHAFTSCWHTWREISGSQACNGAPRYAGVLTAHRQHASCY